MIPVADVLGTESLLDTLTPWLQAPRWWVALSGGLDSCVLLKLLADARETHALPMLTAVHVDHQLSANAPAWRHHCETLCRQLGVELIGRQVTVEPAARGLEAAAREARYRVFEALVGPGELLLMAHHLDDQVETFFLRLMRAAGPRGLSGMPPYRKLGSGELCRPLLGFSRAALESYARAVGLRWIEDESNQDLSLDRNYLRHRVLPRLAERWPGYRASVAASIEAVADAEACLATLERQRLESACTSRFGEAVVRVKALGAGNARDLARLLRRWLEGEACEPPGRDKLIEFARQLRCAEPHARPSLAGPDYTLRRYRDAVHLCRDVPDIRLPEPCALAPGQVLEIPGLGVLQMRPVEEAGLRVPASGFWLVRLRQGGERCQPTGRARSQSLKKLLQNSAVPPWWRQRLPLLYADGELAAVANLWVCSGHSALDEPGYLLGWEPADSDRAD